MRSPRAHPGKSPGRGRGRASSGPSRLSFPIRPVSTATARPSDPRLDGRPPLPGTHRYQRGGLPAAPSPQARRRRRLRRSPPARRRTKAPPTDRRGHEAMAVRAESGGRGRARSGRRGSVARARGFTAGLSWGCRAPWRGGRGSGYPAAAGDARARRGRASPAGVAARGRVSPPRGALPPFLAVKIGHVNPKILRWSLA